MKKRIVIYDDAPPFRGRVRAAVESVGIVRDEFEVETPDDEEMRHSLETLGERRSQHRREGTWVGGSTSLDDASIFVVDYDLFDALPFLDGETLAYLARCFSTCGLIVGYRFADDSFDLTLRGGLRGEPASFTDLYVGGAQLSALGLWEPTGATAESFRPWHWPLLPGYLRDFEEKVEGVRRSLADEVPICQVLGFSPELFARLPRSISEFLGAPPGDVTFAQFVTASNNGLEPRDRPSEAPVHEDVLARVGAARISKWLERLVLPEQDILVDAPHLVLRFPSLLTGGVTDVEAWNATARLATDDELGVSTSIIREFRLKEHRWVSRPVWFWDELRECEDIAEVKEPWKFDKPDWVFCEDTSRFHERSECREFVADVESPYARRFVRSLENVEYRPNVRFSL